MNFLEFERPIAEMEAQIEELRLMGDDSEINITEEIDLLPKLGLQLLGQFFFVSVMVWILVSISRKIFKRSYDILLDFQCT